MTITHFGFKKIINFANKIFTCFYFGGKPAIFISWIFFQGVDVKFNKLIIPLKKTNLSIILYFKKSIIL
jgi:hypothetical protein